MTWPQPGDVAMVECSDGVWRRAVCANYFRACWLFPDGKSRCTDESNARPLVVIDPENEEEVVLLVNAYYNAPDSPAAVNQMQDALRSLIADPEPEEPTGLGALVAAGLGKYLRLGGGTWIGAHWPGSQRAEGPQFWSDLPRPLTVLSKGYVLGAES